MKKLLMIISFMVLASTLFAQGSNRQRPSKEDQLEKVTKELSLTDQQVEQWTAIHEKYESALQDRDQARETRKKMGAELEAILTEEQLAKFKEMRENRKGRRPN